MQCPPSILCYGRDFILLETRQKVLERAGFASAIAHSQPELERYLREYAVDVLVICHSVSTADCEQAKRIAHGQADLTLVLLLNKGVHKCDEDGTDASFDARQGPANLLQTIAALLRNHEQTLKATRRKKPIPAGLHEKQSLPGLNAQRFL